MNAPLKLGFSTGCLYKNLEVKEAIQAIKNLGCKYIELGFTTAERFFGNQLDEISKEDLDGFEYVSLHAPSLNYGNNEKTKRFLQRISSFNQMRKLDLIVFHPDTVENFSVFSNTGLNIGFENMDNRKVSCKSVKEIEAVLSKNNDFKFVLDINHCYSIDRSLGLAREFYQKLSDKISQIHLSGFRELHDPLFETQQTEMVKAIQNLSVPIIIESLLTPETLEAERDYILQNIQALI